MNDWKDLENELRELRPAKVTNQQKQELLYGEKVESKKYEIYWMSVAAVAVIMATILWGMSLNINNEKRGLTDQDIVDAPQKIIRSFEDENSLVVEKNDQKVEPETIYYQVEGSNNEIIYYLEDKPFRKIHFLVTDKDSVDVEGNTVEIIQSRKEEYLIPIMIY